MSDEERPYHREGRIPRLARDAAIEAANEVGLPEYMADLSVFQVLLHHPELGDAVEDVAAVAAAGMPGCDLLARLVEMARGAPGMSTGSLLERFRGEAAEKHLARLATEEVPAAVDDDNLSKSEEGR